jgi:acyl-CoA reductase-like NAD-dependent aldehyde dehydrogenase
MIYCSSVVLLVEIRMTMIYCPNLIAGHEVISSHFWASSQFYPEYRVKIADASALDVAAAIGATRLAEKMTPSARVKCLLRAADIFQVGPAHIEHTVRMTGLPYQVIAGLLEEIPAWLREVIAVLGQRFEPLSDYPAAFLEHVTDTSINLRVAVEGYCYAVTPANDPRAAALVTANLGYLGIPAILKVAKGDAISPLVIQALIAAGFDPGFFNLLAFDNRGSDANAKHAHLVDQASAIWSFGSHTDVDNALRFRATGTVTALDLSDLDDSTSGLAARLGALPDRVLATRLQVTTEQRDGFAGKSVLYHACAACAAILAGPFNEKTADFLRRSTAYASGCNATRAIAQLIGKAWVDHAVDFFASLIVGDPLDPETDVGYIHPSNLDYVEYLIQKYRHAIHTYGGQRISPFQATPVLIESSSAFPELFGQEIPSCFLASIHARDLLDAVKQLNAAIGDDTRMAVAIHGVEENSARKLLPEISAQIILIDQPTTRVIPYCHEGNDYAHLLTTVKRILHP